MNLAKLEQKNREKETQERAKVSSEIKKNTDGKNSNIKTNSNGGFLILLCQN